MVWIWSVEESQCDGVGMNSLCFSRTNYYLHKLFLITRRPEAGYKLQTRYLRTSSPWHLYSILESGCEWGQTMEFKKCSLVKTCSLDLNYNASHATVLKTVRCHNLFEGVDGVCNSKEPRILYKIRSEETVTMNDNEILADFRNARYFQI